MNKELIYNSVNSVLGNQLNESIGNHDMVADGVYKILSESAEFYDGKSDYLLECASKALAFETIGKTNSGEYLKFLFEAIDKLSNEGTMLLEDYTPFATSAVKGVDNSLSQDAEPRYKDLGLTAGAIGGVNAYNKLASSGKLGQKALTRANKNIQASGKLLKSIEAGGKTASKAALKGGNLTLKILYKFFPKLAVKVGPKIAKMSSLAAKGVLIGGTAGAWLVVELVLFIIGKGGVRVLQSNTKAGRFLVKKMVDFIKKHPNWTKFLCSLWMFVGYGDFKKTVLTKAIEYGYISNEEAQQIENNSNVFGSTMADNYTDNNASVDYNGDILENNIMKEEEVLRQIIRESIDESALVNLLKNGAKRIGSNFKKFGNSFGKIKDYEMKLLKSQSFKLKKGPFAGTEFKLENGIIKEKLANGKWKAVKDKQKLNSAKSALKNFDKNLMKQKSIRNSGFRNMALGALTASGLALGSNLGDGTEEQPVMSTPDTEAPVVPQRPTEPVQPTAPVQEPTKPAIEAPVETKPAPVEPEKQITEPEVEQIPEPEKPEQPATIETPMKVDSQIVKSWKARLDRIPDAITKQTKVNTLIKNDYLAGKMTRAEFEELAKYAGTYLGGKNGNLGKRMDSPTRKRANGTAKKINGQEIRQANAMNNTTPLNEAKQHFWDLYNRMEDL